MKKHKLFSLAFIGTLFALSFSTYKPKAQLQTPVLSAIRYENEEIAQEESSYTIDENKNGIPDVVEDYWDENISMYIGGISLATLIGLLISIVTIFYNVSKTNTATKLAKEQNKETKKLVADSIDSQKIVLNEYKEAYYDSIKKCDELTQVNKELMTEIAITRDELLRQREESNTLAEKYSSLQYKLDVILQNQAEMSKTTDYVKAGACEIVTHNAKEAIGYGTEENSEGN